MDDVRVSEAVRRRSSFNAIHLETLTKIDVFVPGDSLMARQEMMRRQRIELADSPGSVLQVASAEDVILQKLAWFRRGGEISERQWNDVLGILKVKRSTVDREYLLRWAPDLEVADLLSRILLDAGLEQA